MREILDQSQLLSLTPAIANQAIEFRRQRKMPLPDVVIAATAWVHGQVLVTADLRGFPALLPPSMLYNPLGP